MALLVMMASDAAAQEAGGKPVPAGWKVRTDDPAQSAGGVEFVDMAPGWHITTGPHAILWHPDSAASGSYRLEAEIFLFDPGQRREGFGLLFGGRDLDGAGQRYSYFLIRQDGRYLIKRRNGGETPTVTPWTEHSAIVKWSDHGDRANVRNVLAVDVGRDEVAFSVNGQEVARVPRAQLDTDGIVGLRLSHALNLHVARITIQQR